MKTWHPRILERSRSKYLGIVDALERDILDGRVRPGALLPSQRVIARDLAVDLTTVTRAFAEARRRGLIQARAGRGTFAQWPESAPKALPANTSAVARDKGDLDLGMNNPPRGWTSGITAKLSRDLARLLAEQPRMLDYPSGESRDKDSQAGAAWLGRHLVAPPAEHLLISAGAQAALFGIFHLLCQPRDRVCMPSLVYPGAKAIMRNLRLQPVPLEQDEDGIMPEAFLRACQKAPIRALYLTPEIDNPTTATLPAPRRREIANIAQRYGVPIVEDAPYAPLKPGHSKSFAELAPGLTWHVSTMSKVLSPALRLAYVTAPSTTGARHLAEIFRATQLTPSPISAALVRRWIGDGTADQICRDMSQENAARQRLASSVLNSAAHGACLRADPVGPHGWLHLPASWTPSGFAEDARSVGVTVVAASEFAIGESLFNAVRLSFGTPRSHAALKAALRLLATILAQPPAPEIRTVV